MPLRSQAALSLPLLLAVPTALVAPAGAQGQQQSPQTALVTTVKGREVTLAIGKNDGAVKGAIYQLTRGATSARVQITSVRDGESTAQVIALDNGFVITVGDTAKFVEVGAIQAPLPAPSGPLGTSPTTPAVTGTDVPAATQAVITKVSGKTVMLDIGSATGAKVGAVYAVPLTGAAKVKIQITAVSPNGATATVFQAAEDFILTVGDQAKFAGIEAMHVAAATPPPVPQATPAGTQVTPLPPTQVTPDIPDATAVVVPTGNSISGAAAGITAVKGNTITIGAGTAQGVNPATNLPILRAGKIIGLVRIQIATPTSSSGVVLWRDENLPGITVGDAVGILGAAPTVGVPTLGGSVDTKIPSVAIKYETKASNAVVPKADPTYDLLAALAAKGLIKSTPASVFADDGARRHRTAEDITFSRAQIAGFIKEAINNADNDDAARAPAALTLLVRDYQKDLKQIGVDKAVVDSYFGTGFKAGISGQSRATFVGGDKDNFIDPFSDSKGSGRDKSGFDSHTSVFGLLSKDVSFMVSADGGSDLRKNQNNDNYDLRRGYVSWNADKALRGLTVNLGRQEFWWGPGHFGTSLLGDAAGGLNAFNTSFQRGSYKLESLYSPLGHGPVGSPRSLYGQNFSVKVGTQSKIGIANTVLSPSDTFDPALFFGAFTPISLYTIDRLGNKKDKTNAIVQGYFETSLARGVRGYGELFFDDFSFNSNNPIENRDGSVLGAHFFDPKNPAKMGLYTEYARFNSLSYLTFLGANRDADYNYFYRGTSLGYPITPFYNIASGTTGFGGAESLRLEGYWMPKRKLRLTAGVEFSDINVEDQAPSANGGRGFSRQQVYRLAASYDLTKRFTLTARAQRVDTDQPNFIKGEGEAKRKQFSLEIANHF